MDDRPLSYNGPIRLVFFILWFNAFGTVLSLCSPQPQSKSNLSFKYTINLMWINRRLNEAQRYLYPASNEKKLSQKFLRHIFKWATVHQQSTVHLWFDSVLTPSAAVKETERLIADHKQTHSYIAPIILRDVRTLPYVIANPEVFSDKLPIFFRVDLLRIIAQVHDVSTGATPYFVYSDFDIDPLSREEIFDEETLQKLQTFGIVMTYHPSWGFENGFSIVSNGNAQLMEAMKYAQIDLNIQRAYNALQGKFYKTEHVTKIMPLVEQAMNNEPNDNAIAAKPLAITHHYSINIMWINNKLKENQRYIHPGLNEDELQESFFQRIFSWAAMNPNGTINLWFDSTTTSDAAVKNTTQLINNTHPEMSNIVLRDIRDLRYVQDHQELFSRRTYVFRNEVLQILTAMSEVETKRVSYAIFGSLLELEEYKNLFDLKSISVEDFFDQQALNDLQKFGITITYRGGLTKGIIGGNTTRLFEILLHNWIEPNSEKALNKLGGTDCCNTCCVHLSGLQQIIWASYRGMFKYFYHGAGFGKLIVENFNRLSKQFSTHEYDKNIDGLTPFGLDRFAIEGDFNAFPQLPEAGVDLWVPTKKIAYPKATLIYEDEADIRSIKLPMEPPPNTPFLACPQKACKLKKHVNYAIKPHVSFDKLRTSGCKIKTAHGEPVEPYERTKGYYGYSGWSCWTSKRW